MSLRRIVIVSYGETVKILSHKLLRPVSYSMHHIQLTYIHKYISQLSALYQVPYRRYGIVLLTGCKLLQKFSLNEWYHRTFCNTFQQTLNSTVKAYIHALAII